jgi:hypothetical protein
VCKKEEEQRQDFQFFIDFVTDCMMRFKIPYSLYCKSLICNDRLSPSGISSSHCEAGIAEFIVCMQYHLNVSNIQILLPSLAGSTAVCFTHPMDLTKIRLQLGSDLYTLIFQIYICGYR